MSSTLKLVLAGVVGLAVGYAACHFMAKKHTAAAAAAPAAEPKK